MEISITEAQKLLDEYDPEGGWRLGFRVAPNWIDLDDSGRFLTYSSGEGHEEIVFQVDLADGSYRHRGTGPADCYSDWEGGRHFDEDDEDEDDYDYEDEREDKNMIIDANCTVKVSEDGRISIHDGLGRILTYDGESIYNPTDAEIDAFAREHGFYYEVDGLPYGGWSPWQAISNALTQVEECWECPYCDECEAYQNEE